MSKYSGIQGIPSKTDKNQNSDDKDRFLFTHPSGSYIKSDEQGSISMAVDKSTSFVLSPSHSSVLMSGKFINILGAETRVYTRPNGFIWNGNYLNPSLYENHTEVLTKDGTYVKILVEAPDYQFKHELNDMLKNLGIE